MTWISLISLAFLILIALSDFKNRQIPIIYLMGETISSFCLGYALIGGIIMKCVIMNFVIITFQILVLWAFIKIKYGNSGKNLWSRFGKGDVFMLAISAINLSALNYLLFIIIVSLTSVLIWLGYSTIRKINDQTIPFAGFLSGGLMTLRIIQMTGSGITFYSDNYILNLIYGI